MCLDCSVPLTLSGIPSVSAGETGGPETSLPVAASSVLGLFGMVKWRREVGRGP